MCFSEPLPRTDLNERILRNLRDVNDPSNDLPPDADIEDAARNNTPLDGDFPAHEADEVGQVAFSLNHLRMPGALLDRDRGVQVRLGYLEIFQHSEGIARRVDRTFHRPTVAMKDMMKHTLKSVERWCDPEFEFGYPPNLFSDDFKTLIRKHLPTKLSLESWVGQLAFDKLSRNCVISHGKLMPWKPWMRPGPGRKGPAPEGLEFLDDYLAFLGTGGTAGGTECRWIYREDKWGVKKPKTAKEEKFHAHISLLIHEAEDDLVKLSIQIANWVADWLVESYAHNLVHERNRRELTGVDILDAVLEILGDEWFDLPFDVEGKLKKWKFRRTLPIPPETYYHILIE